MTETIKNHLLDLVGRGELQKAMDALLKLELGGSVRKEVVAIAGRWRRLKAGRRLGVFTFQEDAVTENQIASSLVELIHFPEDATFPEEQSINERVPVRVLWWKYVGYVAVVVGLLTGITTFALNIDRLFGGREPLLNNTVTVLVHGEKGKDQRVLPSRGNVTLAYGEYFITRQTNNEGEVVFQYVPEHFFAADARVEVWFTDPGGEPYRAVHHDSVYRLHKEQYIPLLVKLEHLDSIFGIVKDFVSGEPLEGAKVRVRGIETFSNADGEFLLVIPPRKQQQFQTIRAQKEGYEFYELGDVPVQTTREIPVVMKPK